jgi:23S rRNA (cytidine2498-2'-O)-methyltransferase
MAPVEDAMRRRADDRLLENAQDMEGPALAVTPALWTQTSAPFTAYLAPPGRRNELRQELGDVMAEHGRLLLAPGAPRASVWAENIWLAPRLLQVSSIKDTARQLRALQRNWALYAVHLHRRSALVVDALPHVSARPLVFPAPLPTAPLGSWTLLDQTTLLASPECSSRVPNGQFRFVEDHENPPSRAYLKLFEALTRFGEMPGPSDRCVDLGASPGGWTWVLAELGADVVAVDKAPLAPRVSSRPNVEMRQESAFGLSPGQMGPIDWLFSDIICYPQRLCDLIERWQRESDVERMICTVKFQGETDFEALARLAQIPGATLCHLFHNKHELTFFWRRTDRD